MNINHKINVINNADGKVNVTVEQTGNSVEIIISAPEEKVQLSSLEPGQVFKGKDEEFILLEFDKDGNACVLKKELLKQEMRFGETNNFDGSDIDKFLNTDYMDVLYDEFESHNLVVQELDLITMDGNRKYGKIKRVVSLLDFDRYRRCRDQIGKDIDREWWLRDADSIFTSVVRYVDSCGRVCYCSCVWNGHGVRPFFVLKSSIFVSLGETIK